MPSNMRESDLGLLYPAQLWIFHEARIKTFLNKQDFPVCFSYICLFLENYWRLSPPTRINEIGRQRILKNGRSYISKKPKKFLITQHCACSLRSKQ